MKRRMLRRFARRQLARGVRLGPHRSRSQRGARGRHTSASAIHPGPLRALLARLIAAAVPKNASGNNASVR